MTKTDVKATVTLACVLLLRLYFLDHMLVPSDVDNPLWASGRTKCLAGYQRCLLMLERAATHVLSSSELSISRSACPQIDYIGDYKFIYTRRRRCRGHHYLHARILPFRGTLEIIGPLLLWLTVPALPATCSYEWDFALEACIL